MPGLKIHQSLDYTNCAYPLLFMASLNSTIVKSTVLFKHIQLAFRILQAHT